MACHRRRPILYTSGVARWAADAKTRLEQAALDLFAAQGFQETTVPQITARAGLTTRTFFRHFADKREVLFARDAEVPAFIGQLMARAPAHMPPMALIAEQLSPFAQAVFGEHRETLRQRHRIIETDQGLRERDFQKMHRVREAIVTGFVGRGTGLLDAQIAADLSMSVLGAALERWLSDDGDLPLTDYVAQAMQALNRLLEPLA